MSCEMCVNLRKPNYVQIENWVSLEKQLFLSFEHRISLIIYTNVKIMFCLKFGVSILMIHLVDFNLYKIKVENMIFSGHPAYSCTRKMNYTHPFAEQMNVFFMCSTVWRKKDV